MVKSKSRISVTVKGTFNFCISLLSKTPVVYFILAAVGIAGFLSMHEIFLVKKLYLYKDIGGDSFYGEWPLLAYINTHLQNGSLGWWTFSIGIGTNILALNHYLFDPFCWPLFFGSLRTMTLVLPYVFVAKMMAASLFFYFYLSHFSLSRSSLFIFSFLFGFSGYMIVWGRFLAFGTAITYFALILATFEFYLKTNRKWPLIAGLFLMAVFSHYFLFYVTIFTGIYALLRKPKTGPMGSLNWTSYILNLAGIYTLGLALSAPILLPSMAVTLESPRLGGLVEIWKIGRFDFYLALVSRFYSNHIQITAGHFFYEQMNYFETPAVFAGLLPLLVIPQLFSVKDKKNRKFLFGWLGFSVVLLIFPIFADALNLFSYRQYRWSFLLPAVTLLFGARAFSQITSTGLLQRKNFLITVFSLVFILTAVLLFAQSGSTSATGQLLTAIALNRHVFILLGIEAVLIWFLQFKKSRRVAEGILIMVILFESIQHAHFDIVKNRLLLNGSELGTMGYFDGIAELTKNLRSNDKPDFFRLAKNYLSGSWNDPTGQDYYGTTAYISLNAPGYLAFLDLFNYSYPTKNVVRVSSDRLELNSLLSVRYYLTRSEGDKPYGFSLHKKAGPVYVYENQFSVPLVFWSDTFIEAREFVNASSEIKDVMSIKGFVGARGPSWPKTMKPIEVGSPGLHANPVVVPLSDQIETANLRVLDAKVPALFRFEALTQNPVAVFYLENSVQGLYTIHFNLESAVETSGQIFWRNRDEDLTESKSRFFQIPAGKNKFTFDLGRTSVVSIRVDIMAKSGVFSLSEMKILTRPTSFDANQYQRDIEKLRQSNFVLHSFSEGMMTGEVNVPADGMIGISIPFDRGWKLIVDEKSVDTVPIHGGLIGAPVSAGQHRLQLKFVPRGLLVGLWIGGFALIVSLARLLLSRLKFRRFLP